MKPKSSVANALADNAQREQRSSRRNKVLVVLVLLAGLGGGFWYLRERGWFATPPGTVLRNAVLLANDGEYEAATAYLTEWPTQVIP